MNNKTYSEKIQLVITRGEGTSMLPDNAPLVAMFLKDRKPAADAGHADIYLSSMEIAAWIEDMATMTVNEVTAVMLFLGYEMAFSPTENYAWAIDKEQKKEQ